MLRPLEKTLLNYKRPYLTEAELEILLNSTPNSRYSKVKRMVARGKLLSVRRGLYCITEELGYRKKPLSFELAQYIYGPSFISLESALSFHGLIPEAVYTTTSVSGKRKHEFKTPLGVFSYLTAPQKELFVEVELIEENDYKFFMAKPWRAICDYIFCYKKTNMSLKSLFNNLRINLENLPYLSPETAQRLADYYHNPKMAQFLKEALRLNEEETA
ncbi:MAG TPA: hypothetical protein VHA13_00420 [Gammaproteobacteria bacterium]|nr:hypothetical protein [Gammaproteobacteria bacterium]